MLLKSIAVIALIASTAHAGDYVPPEFLSLPPALPAEYDASNVLRLDLADALTIAMRENLGVVLERKRLQTTQLAESAAWWSMYEPTISANVSHAGAQTPPMTAQAGPAGAIIASTTDSAGISINQRLPTGALLSLGFTGARVGSSAGTAVEPLNYASALTFSITQPLFRSFSRDLAIPQMSILTAKIATEQERHSLELTAAQLVQQTESAYWDVVLALYSYDVALQSEHLAEDSVTTMRRQTDAGMTAPAELTGAQSTHAQRQLAVLSAAQSVEQSWDALRTVMNLPRDQWTRPLLPTERPNFDASIATTEEVAFQTALVRRPEIAQADLDLQAMDLAVRKAENDKLPEIDLGLTGALYGQDAALDGSLGQLGSRDANGWSVMLNMTWTPLNKTASANAQAARIQQEIHSANRDVRVQGIWNEVRAAVRNQRAAALQVVASSQSRTLASQSLDIETRKYASGQSSNVDIAQLQNGLASAELSELQALLGQEKASTALFLATGQLLEQRHIDLQLVRAR
jgi:outer membrane protein TolC